MTYLSNRAGDGNNGDVTGPASSSDEAVVRFDGITGKLIQNSSVFITDDGSLGIGTSTPQSKLHVIGDISIPTGNYLILDDAVGNVAVGGNEFVAGEIGIDFVTDGSTKMVITEAGNVGIGTTAPATSFQVATSVTTSPRGIMSSQHNDGTDGARFHMRKSRGTVTAPTVVVTGDTLGRMVGSGYDGTSYLEMASIMFGTEGTIATNRVPTTISFLTATNASPSVQTQALLINSSQQCLFNDGSASLPSISFASNPDTGILLNSSVIGFTVDGTQRITVLSGGIQAQSSSGGRLSSTGATATAPAFAPNRADTTTGIGAQAAGNMSLIIAGAETARLTSTALIFPTDNTIDIGASGATRPRNIYASNQINCANDVVVGDAIIFGSANSSVVRAPSDGAVTILNNAVSTNATLLHSVVVSAKTQAVSPYSVTILENLTHFTNEGATGAVTFTLPTAVAGYTYTFIVQDADDIIITANTGDTIRIAGSVTATAGSITGGDIGSTVTLVAINATEWIATAVNGTWTF